jgi:PleD family two-component response regulator
MLLPHTDRAASSRVAQRLLRAVAGMAPVSVGGAVHRVRALAGVTSSTRGASTFDQLHDEALAALARARAGGPDVVVAP